VRERVSGTSAILNMLSQKVGRAPVVLMGALENSDIEVVEIIVSDKSAFAGARLSEVNLPGEALVISVVRGGRAMIPMPIRCSK